MMDFNLRDDKLHATAVIRSNNMFFGWPGNILQTRTLQDYICKKLGCQPGRIATNLSLSSFLWRAVSRHRKNPCNKRKKITSLMFSISHIQAYLYLEFPLLPSFHLYHTCIHPKNTLIKMEYCLFVCAHPGSLQLALLLLNQEPCSYFLS